jgi:hypothetical protein
VTVRAEHFNSAATSRTSSIAGGVVVAIRHFTFVLVVVWPGPVCGLPVGAISGTAGSSATGAGTRRNRVSVSILRATRGAFSAACRPSLAATRKPGQIGCAPRTARPVYAAYFQMWRCAGTAVGSTASWVQLGTSGHAEPPCPSNAREVVSEGLRHDFGLLGVNGNTLRGPARSGGAACRLRCARDSRIRTCAEGAAQGARCGHPHWRMGWWREGTAAPSWHAKARFCRTASGSHKS